MFYYKIRAGMYAAHREPSCKMARPEISQVGYVQRLAKDLWDVYLATGHKLNHFPYTSEGEAKKALEAHADKTVARATWMK